MFTTLLFLLNVAIGATVVGFAVSYLYNRFVQPRIPGAPTIGVFEAFLAYAAIEFIVGAPILLGLPR